MSLSEHRRATLAALADVDPRAAIVALDRDDPARLDVLLTLVAGAYHLSEDVRGRLRYPGQRPVGPVRPDPDLDRLTAAVRRRGRRPR